MHASLTPRLGWKLRAQDVGPGRQVKRNVNRRAASTARDSQQLPCALYAVFAPIENHVLLATPLVSGDSHERSCAHSRKPSAGLYALPIAPMTYAPCFITRSAITRLRTTQRPGRWRMLLHKLVHKAGIVTALRVSSNIWIAHCGADACYIASYPLGCIRLASVLGKPSSRDCAARFECLQAFKFIPALPRTTASAGMHVPCSVKLQQQLHA